MALFDSLIGGINELVGNNPTDGTNALMRFGNSLLSASNGQHIPSSILEYQHYINLPTDKQKEDYLLMKRQQQWLNTGGEFTNPAMGLQIPKTLPPQDEPEVRGEQARRTKRGEVVGAKEGETKKKELQAPQVLDLLTRAEELLPGATGGGAKSIGRDIAAFAGYATPGSEADSQLDVIGAALTSGVPRMEGPQSNYDVKLYEKAAGDIANSSKPISVRQAAIKTIRGLQEKYAGVEAAAPSGMAQMPPAAQHSGRIIKDTATGKRYKSDGKEWVPQ